MNQEELYTVTTPDVVFNYEDLWWDKPESRISIFDYAKNRGGDLVSAVIYSFARYTARTYGSYSRVELLDICRSNTPDALGNEWFALIRYNGYNVTELACNADLKVECYMD